MTPAVDWYAAPCDPELRRAAYDRNLRAGHRMMPGASDLDVGLLVFDSLDATAPLWKPVLRTPEARQDVASVRWAQIIVPIAAAAWCGILGGVLCRIG